MNILFLSQTQDPAQWLPGLRKCLPHDCFLLATDSYDPAAIDVALVLQPPPDSVARLRNLKLIHSLWMGVDGLLADRTLPRDKPLARMVDPGMISAMTETVLAHVLDWHHNHCLYRRHQAERKWLQLPQYLASDRTVGILGLGELGGDAARRLLALGFRVCGWSRRPRQIPEVQSLHGPAGLAELLERSNAVICLLPLTAETRRLLNAQAFARMPRGGCVINVARGAHVVEADLIAALDAGQLAHAYLDVFDTEPLPPESPLWTHPGVSITPHAAAFTDPRTAIPEIAQNIERIRSGQPALHLVDFSAGY